MDIFFEVLFIWLVGSILFTSFIGGLQQLPAIPPSYLCNIWTKFIDFLICLPTYELGFFISKKLFGDIEH